MYGLLIKQKEKPAGSFMPFLNQTLEYLFEQTV